MDLNYVERPDNSTASGPVPYAQTFIAPTGSPTLLNYKNGDSGRYTITSSMPCAVISLFFTKIDVEDTILCNNDYLTIYDGIDDTAPPMVTVCGGADSFELSTSVCCVFLSFIVCILGVPLLIAAP